MTTTAANRWMIAATGVLMQIALGAVYAWSVFRIPLTQNYGWTISQVTVAFELAILVLGFAAFAGGLWIRGAGPRPVVFLAAILYGLGTALAGLSHSLPSLYLTYGVIGGAGLGLGYIVPVATLIGWFPDKRGLITGIAVAGFGAGALITAPIAERLIATVGVSSTFVVLGIAYFIILALAATVMRNPPEGYMPQGFKPSAADGSAALALTLRQALGTWQWYGLWLTLFLNTAAGISIISQAAPMAQEISHVSSAAAAALVGIISIANGCGRFLWAWFSDIIGRKAVFVTMFLLQGVAFLLLSNVVAFGSLTGLAFVILLCYGGGFGTMPAFAADYFGAKDIGSIYGLMLTAWGVAAVVGPTLIAYVRQATGEYQGALEILALITLLSAILPLLLHPLGLRPMASASHSHVQSVPRRAAS
ncbi:MAG: MFS transporter [Acidobacteria bacterium 13_1_40CM_2_56_5]|nr:MAG: MFS transporter [Acidobacteria bacterium 13_1_40CM_2_56_5]